MKKRNKSKANSFTLLILIAIAMGLFVFTLIPQVSHTALGQVFNIPFTSFDDLGFFGKTSLIGALIALIIGSLIGYSFVLDYTQNTNLSIVLGIILGFFFAYLVKTFFWYGIVALIILAIARMLIPKIPFTQ